MAISGKSSKTSKLQVFNYLFAQGGERINEKNINIHNSYFDNERFGWL